MMNKTTVFILGAGASVPFGYPTAFELQEQLKDFLKYVPAQDNALLPKDYQYKQKFWDDLGVSRNELLRFSEALSKSVRYSIDKFLERRPNDVNLGKLLITYMLKQKEQAYNLQLGLTVNNWYAELANRLDLTPDNAGDLKLSFITFNYDRSLEYSLYNLLKYRTTDLKKAQEAFNKIKIVHIYGGFNNFPWEEKGISYDYNVTPEILIRLANTIKIMSDERDTEELKSARQFIEKADYIYFIGFGYDKDNLKRLGIPFKRPTNATFRGTAFGLSNSDRQRIGEHTNPVIILSEPECNIMSFLDKYVLYQ